MINIVIEKVILDSSCSIILFIMGIAIMYVASSQKEFEIIPFMLGIMTFMFGILIMTPYIFTITVI